MAFLTKYGRKICNNLFYRSSSSYWGLVASFAVLKFSANKANQSYATDVFARLISRNDIHTKRTSTFVFDVVSILSPHTWVSFIHPLKSKFFFEILVSSVTTIFVCKKTSNYVQMETEGMSYV